MLLSTYQMQKKQLEKLTQRFIRPYKVKKIISINVIKLDLLSIVKILQ